MVRFWGEAMFGISLVVALLGPGAAPPVKAVPATGPVTESQVRTAVRRAVPFLEKEGVAWLNGRKCIACHHGAWMVWGLSEARRAGLEFDEKKLNDLANRVASTYLADRTQHQQKKTGYVEGTYLLMSGYGDGNGKEKVAEARRAAFDLIVRGQGKDGFWTYQGQGLDRPAKEADEATTLWAVLALLPHAKADKEKSSKTKALDWLKRTAQGAGNESLALRLVVETRFGDARRAQALKEELLRRQNADGGWSWSKTRSSDPFATGESLYALSLAGVKKDSSAVRAGWSFLVRKQRPDGSWLAPTKKPKGGNDISTYWGSAWAVIGLSRTLQETTR
jgi:hypothetical protein